MRGSVFKRGRSWTAQVFLGRGGDDAQFRPMVAETITNLRRAGSRSRVRTVVADAGYWCKDNLEWCRCRSPHRARQSQRHRPQAA